MEHGGLWPSIPPGVHKRAIYALILNKFEARSAKTQNAAQMRKISLLGRKKDSIVE
jgi:hypothetical protein